MILNGVKPWIVSKEDEQTHLTSLNSLRMFQNCAPSLIINGSRDRTVQDQIMNALKLVTERMATKNGEKLQEETSEKKSDNTARTEKKSEKTALTGKSKSTKGEKKKKMFLNNDVQERENNSKENLRNVVVFTGRAL